MGSGVSGSFSPQSGGTHILKSPHSGRFHSTQQMERNYAEDRRVVVRRACGPRPGIPGILLGAGEGGSPAQLPEVPERNVQAGAPSVKGHLRAVLREDLGKCPFTRAGRQAGVLGGGLEDSGHHPGELGGSVPSQPRPEGL